MATALRSFRKVQLGLESAKGTAVAAVVAVPCNATYQEEQDFYRSDYPEGVRANVGGAGTILRKGVAFDVETELTAEDILWPLSTGLLGAVTPTQGGAGEDDDFTWVFTPEVATGVPTLDSATVEFVQGDGVANHYAQEAAYAMTSGYRIETQINQIARLNWSMFARASGGTTPTASLAPYAGREPLASSRGSFFWNDSWANLGNTQLTGIVRSSSLEVMTGLGPGYTLDGRTQVDHTGHRLTGKVGATFSLSIEFDAVAAARFQNYRDNDVVYVRHLIEGSEVEESVNRSVQHDLALRFNGAPSFTEDGELVLMSANLETFWDASAEETLEVTVVNALGALAPA